MPIRSIIPTIPTVADLRKDDPTLSRQAARKIVRTAKKKADPNRPGPNPSVRVVHHGFGAKRTMQTLRLGGFHEAVPYIPGCRYQRALLKRIGIR